MKVIFFRPTCRAGTCRNVTDLPLPADTCLFMVYDASPFSAVFFAKILRFLKE